MVRKRMKARIEPLVLLDNAVLSNFANIQQPMLIKMALGDTVSTVQEVIDELMVGVEKGAIPDVNWAWLPILSMTHDEHLKMMIDIGYFSPVDSLTEILYKVAL